MRRNFAWLVRLATVERFAGHGSAGGTGIHVAIISSALGEIAHGAARSTADRRKPAILPRERAKLGQMEEIKKFPVY
jgi:hypothetical protein